jgi:membrane associated rhomboid family serine protease
MAQRSVLGSAVIPLRLVFLMWLFFFLEYNFGLPLSAFGIHPRSLIGLIGIIISPMVHGNIVHLISNTFPLLFLGGVLFYFYPRIAVSVFFRAYIWTNILVWLFARNANHIGASIVLRDCVFPDIFWIIAKGFYVAADFHCYDPALWRGLLWCSSYGS